MVGMTAPMHSVRTLLILLLCASPAASAELQTLAGKTLVGDFVRLTDKEIVLKTDTGEVTTPVLSVLQLKLQDALPPTSGIKYTDVELTDGTLLHCKQFVPKGKEAELVLLVPDGATKEPLRIQAPLSAIHYVLNDAHDPAVRQEWQEKFLAKQG